MGYEVKSEKGKGVFGKEKERITGKWERAKDHMRQCSHLYSWYKGNVTTQQNSHFCRQIFDDIPAFLA